MHHHRIPCYTVHDSGACGTRIGYPGRPAASAAGMGGTALAADSYMAAFRPLGHVGSVLGSVRPAQAFIFRDWGGTHLSRRSARVSCDSKAGMLPQHRQVVVMCARPPVHVPLPGHRRCICPACCSSADVVDWVVCRFAHSCAGLPVVESNWYAFADVWFACACVELDVGSWP